MPAGPIRPAVGASSSIWESEEDGQNWFDENVKPVLPEEIVPNRTYHKLHTAFTK